jgi:hypothetical protein
MRKFIGWLRDWISHSSDTQTSEYLKKLAHGPIFTIVTYQWYNINGYMFYTEQQDKKSTYQNSGVRVDAYDTMSQDKNMYYGQIQEIWEFDFHGFKISLFRCNWVDGIKGVVQDKYGFQDSKELKLEVPPDDTTLTMRDAIVRRVQWRQISIDINPLAAASASSSHASMSPEARLSASPNPEQLVLSPILEQSCSPPIIEKS